MTYHEVYCGHDDGRRGREDAVDNDVRDVQRVLLHVLVCKLYSRQAHTAFAAGDGSTGAYHGELVDDGLAVEGQCQNFPLKHPGKFRVLVSLSGEKP